MRFLTRNRPVFRAVQVMTLVLLSLIGLRLTAGSALAQNVPPEVVGTWEFSENNHHQVVSFFPDGTYAMYYSQREYDTSGVNCLNQSIAASSGTANFASDEVTLNQAVVYGIERPDCNTEESSVVQQYRPTSFTHPFRVEPNSFFGELVLNGAPHSDRYSSTGQIRSVPLPTAATIPDVLFGEWVSFVASSSIGASTTYSFYPDGTYQQFTVVATSSDAIFSCEATTMYNGSVEMNGILLSMQRESGETTDCQGNPTRPNLITDNRIIWFADDAEDGLTMFIDGSRYTLEQRFTNVPPQTRPSTSTSSFTPFTEDFSANTLGWETGFGLGYISGLVDGVYQMEFAASAESTGWYVAPGFTDWSLAPVFNAPYEVSVDVNASCGGNCGVGITFNLQTNYTGGMFFSYMATGGSDMWTLFQNGIGVIASGEVENEVAIFDGRTHTFTLRVQDGSAELLIDKLRIGAATGDWMVDGTVGLYITRDTNSPVSAIFDNLQVQALS